MASSHCTLSQQASEDIRSITKRSLADFGELQTDTYLSGLRATLQNLADNPALGSLFTHERNQHCYRRFRYLSHMIYYRERLQDVFIVRILHMKMLPTHHL